jgi:hypothetical protein
MNAEIKKQIRIEVYAAAEWLVSRFGAHDFNGYFACFDPTATFIFYNVPCVLNGRAKYMAVWRRWEAEDGFRILGCYSSQQAVHLNPNYSVAVFTHLVETTMKKNGREVVLYERESIVFVKHGQQWIAVHEHLSLQ